jgi:Zn-dependent protease
MHWSWVLMLIPLILIFSQVYGHLVSTLSAWLLALATALLLCVSVVLHEVAHVVVARHYGYRVRAITLQAVGGLAEIDADHTTPIEELLVALAGPCVSLVLALLGALGWWLSPWPALSLLALFHALSNGLIAVFNLLPGYPMDGGQILYAVLWFLNDEDLPSARLAAYIGNVCGWLIILLALAFLLMVGEPIIVVCLILIGFLLVRGAQAGYRQAVLQRILQGISVGDLMQRVYRAVTPDLPLDQFVGHYVLGHIDQGFPVLHNTNEEGPTHLLGMMTLNDLRRFTFKDWPRTYVGEAMTPRKHLRALSPEMAAREAFRTLIESGQEQLPVMEDEMLQGILRRRDLIRYVQMRLQQLNRSH